MEMVEVKVSELAGRALDWAVATIPGTPGMDGLTWEVDPAGIGVGVYMEGEKRIVAALVCSGVIESLRLRRKLTTDGVAPIWYSPRQDWLQGGQIIDREDIGFFQKKDEGYCQAAKPGAEFVQRGPTPLIAAMRCYVASANGETVMVPAELLA